MNACDALTKAHLCNKDDVICRVDIAKSYEHNLQSTKTLRFQNNICLDGDTL